MKNTTARNLEILCILSLLLKHFTTHPKDFRRMGCCNPEGLKQLGGPAVAKWQAATGGSLFLTGLVMVVSGIVILAADCPAVNKPWLLLVYGLITMLTYVWPMLAGIDR